MDDHIISQSRVGWTDSIECIDGCPSIDGGVILSPARMTGGMLVNSILSGNSLLSGGTVCDGCTLESCDIECGRVEGSTLSRVHLNGARVKNSHVFDSSLLDKSIVLDSDIYGAQLLENALVSRSCVKGDVGMWGVRVTIRGNSEVINSLIPWSRDEVRLAAGRYINADVKDTGTLYYDRIGGLSDERLRSQMDTFDEWAQGEQ